MNTQTVSMTPLMHAAVGVGGKLWTGNNGVTRVYICNWYRLAGLEITYAVFNYNGCLYSLGEIHSAYIANGDKIDNCTAREVLNNASGCYVDSEGLHMPRINGIDCLTEAVQATLTAKLEELSDSSI